MNGAILISGAVAVAIGGVAFVMLSGNERSDQRRQAIAKAPTSSSARAAVVDRAVKKRQIQESLQDLEKRARSKRVNLQTRIEQAGLSVKKHTFLMIFAVIAVVLGGLTYFKTQSPALGGLVTLMLAVGAPHFVLMRMRMRRIKRFIDVLPTALDIIVRGVRSGLPLGDTLRIIANEAPEPAKSEFRKVVESQTLGISVAEASVKMAHRVPATETNFFAIVIEIQSKAGGNLSEAVANLSRTVRERKKMKGKISAMSMEALASAAIIGLVPFIVTGALYVIAPKYMGLLFTTIHGRYILMFALGWMSIGAMVMKKMINFDF
jgi:tight adherence protein B